ncbi:MAG TPA: M20/M25/M40 family metallo-hydrolase [Blastocatellia bacterium]|nr:M20/M25/M40 family metallo-hydrolase [Blastocatellia bacterium]
MINRKRISLTLLLLISFLAQTIFAQQPADFQPAASRLTGEILINGRSMDYLKNLTDRFGGRLTGTAAYNRAAEWAAEQFRAAGIKNVRLEPFTIPNGWDRGWAHGRIVSPIERPIHIESLGWSPSTPSGGARGEVIIASDLAPEKIRAQADKIKGCIVKLDLAAIFAEGFDAFAKLIAAIPILKETGAVALVVADSEPNNVLNAFGFTWGAETSALPIAQIGMEDGKLIERLMEKGPVTIEFAYDNKTSGPVQVNNVVAEIRGRERPDEWIIIGAHLDSWDYGTGAQDNGTGCAMVLEAARAIRAMKEAPRRSIRFALWGGEEQGLLGSAAYARAHASELDKCVAALNTDNGAGHPRGWKVEGRKDVADAMKGLSETLLEGLGGGELSQETSFDTDHGHFMLAGIPSFDLWVNMESYGKVHHKSSDTIDKVDAHDLAAGSAIVAVTAYALAERSAPIAPHIDHAAVGEILRKANLERFLKAVGVWN